MVTIILSYELWICFRWFRFCFSALLDYNFHYQLFCYFIFYRFLFHPLSGSVLCFCLFCVCPFHSPSLLPRNYTTTGKTHIAYKYNNECSELSGKCPLMISNILLLHVMYFKSYIHTYFCMLVFCFFFVCSHFYFYVLCTSLRSLCLALSFRVETFLFPWNIVSVNSWLTFSSACVLHPCSMDV